MTASETLPKTDVIPKKINFIWNGSKMRDEHIARIKEWQRLNPDYEVNVWVEKNHESHVRKQLEGATINVVKIATLNIPKETNNFIKKLSKKTGRNIPNYSATSDLYRFYVLDKMGGWYMDNDVIPIDLKTIAIDPTLKFHFNARRDNDEISEFAPSAMASDKGSELTKQALKFIELMSKNPKMTQDNVIEWIGSEFASLRKWATYYTTGYILKAAVGKIIVNGQPIINVNGPKDSTIPDSKVFDKVATKFVEKGDKSWIFADIKPLSNGQAEYYPLSGITPDEGYFDDSKLAWLMQFLDVLKEERTNMYNMMEPISIDLQQQNSASGICSPTDDTCITDKKSETLNPNQPQRQFVTSNNAGGSSQVDYSVNNSVFLDDKAHVSTDSNEDWKKDRRSYSGEFESDAFLTTASYLIYGVSRFFPWNREYNLTADELVKLENYSSKLTQFQNTLKSKEQNKLYRNGTTYELYTDVANAFTRVEELVNTSKKTGKSTSAIMTEITNKINFIETELKNISLAEKKIKQKIRKKKKKMRDGKPGYDNKFSFFVNDKKYVGEVRNIPFKYKKKRNR